MGSEKVGREEEKRKKRRKGRNKKRIGRWET